MRALIRSVAASGSALIIGTWVAAATPAQADKPDPGNNGTVKIAPHGDVDAIPNNAPHEGCVFQLEWFGFDQGADVVSAVTFAEHPPTTGVGMTVNGPPSVFVGADPAAGAGDDGFDGVAVYTLSFTGAPHPQQGYHVGLTISTPRSLGASVKHKVFWVRGCAPPNPPPPNNPPPNNPPPNNPPPNNPPPNNPPVGNPPGGPGPQVEVLGEQASTGPQPGPAAQQPASALPVPTVINAGAERGTDPEDSRVPLLVTLMATLVGVAALADRRRRSTASRGGS
jgi:hypothetical protein